MQFLLFAAQYVPTVGGVERYTQNLAATLVKLGHGAVVVTSALPGLPNIEQTPEGIWVYRLPAHLWMKGRFPVLRRNRRFRLVADELWRRRYDFAVINTRFYHLSARAARMCAKKGVPALVLEHGSKHLSLDSGLLNVFGNVYEHAVMRYIRRWCGRFYGVSQACTAWLAHFHVEAQGVLYNAVDAEQLRALAGCPALEGGDAAEGKTDADTGAAAVDFRIRLGVAADTPLVVFSGRLIREKGIYELLEAFAMLREHLPQAVLMVAGDGPERAAVEASCAALGQDAAFCVGPLPYEENLALVAQGDVYCLPTYSEGFSAAILEAAALETFIVTTPTGGSPELIVDGESGVLLQSLEPVVICEALLRALTDDDFCLAAVKKARQTLEERFTWQRTAARLVEIAEEEGL